MVSSQTFRATPHLSEWATIEPFARRIRHLRSTSSSPLNATFRVCPMTLSMLFGICPHSSLLPNLLEMDYSLRTTHFDGVLHRRLSLDPLEVMFSSTLISINVQVPRGQVDEFASLLVRRCLTIEELSINSEEIF